MRSNWRATVVLCLSILAVFLCAINAGGIGDSIGKSVDELIDESNGIFSSGGQPRNPQEARSMWSQESGVDFTPPGNQSAKSTDTGTGASGASSAVITGQGVSYQTAGSSDADSIASASATGVMGATSQMSETSAASTSAPASTANMEAIQGVPASVSAAEASFSPESSSSLLELAGNWSFRLRDSKTRVMALTLYQSENAVFGTGSINDGGESMKVSASGSLASGKLFLDAVSSGSVVLYRMALTTEGRSMSGDYRAFSPGVPAWTGTAEGTRV